MCVIELAACYGDTECLGCITENYGDEYTERVASYEYDGSDYCAASSAKPCCLDSTSADDCMGNDAFEEYYACFVTTYSIELGEDECSTVSCRGDTMDELVDDTVDELVDDTSGVGSYSPTAMLTCVLGPAFLTTSRHFETAVVPRKTTLRAALLAVVLDM